MFELGNGERITATAMREVMKAVYKSMDDDGILFIWEDLTDVKLFNEDVINLMATESTPDELIAREYVLRRELLCYKMELETLLKYYGPESAAIKATEMNRQRASYGLAVIQGLSKELISNKEPI